MPIISPSAPLPAGGPLATVVVLETPKVDVTANSVSRIRITMRDDLTGALVDTDNLTCTLRAGGAAPVAYVYGISTLIAKVTVGVYDFAVTNAIAGRSTLHVSATGSRPIGAVAYWNVVDWGP